MPVWHESIKKLASDNLNVLAVVQEQHAERARLYAQWKGYDWPIAQDPVTKLGATAVPMFIGIDEHGVVQNTRMKPSDLEAFVSQKFDPPAEAAPVLVQKDFEKVADAARTADDWIESGDDLLLWRRNGKSSLDSAVEAYSRALQDKARSDGQRGAILFRIGVAHRLKYDELANLEVDFDLAAKFWSDALAANPNQYIWRRRIQQYGPRQDKPYPFYDWVATAQQEIRDRGEKPIEQTVELTASEIAAPAKVDDEKTSTPKSENPDPDNKIQKDVGHLIRVESTAVPSFVQAGGRTRINLRFVPASGKWNNEAEPLRVWVESNGVTLSQGNLLTFENPNQPDSKEVRHFEFEAQIDPGAQLCLVKGFALYNTCEETDATCRFMRQDFSIEVPIRDNK